MLYIYTYLHWHLLGCINIAERLDDFYTVLHIRSVPGVFLDTLRSLAIGCIYCASFNTVGCLI